MKKSRIGLLIITVLFMVSSAVNGIAAKETKYTLTNDLDRVRTQHDGGFSSGETIGKDDPHYGWGLGSFYIMGYTDFVRDTDGTIIFLKNVGDELVLGFDLKQNIDKLGKNKNCRINEDSNGYDAVFEVGPTNFGRGCLIVMETDYRNTTHRPVVYTDYLTAVQQGRANTIVKPFAEGDYTITLDYELKSPGFLGVPTYSDYCIYRSFKIRNSNCMVFFYKLGEIQDEITNGAVAEDGFKVDFKNSYFLTVNATKQILVDNDGVLSLDTRFSRAVSDGNEYRDEGLYTITISNQYTKEQVTKVISVGRNKILNVYAAHNGTVDLNEIARNLNNGVKVNDQWKMILPEADAEDLFNNQGTQYNGVRSIGSSDGQGGSGRAGFLNIPNVSFFALAVIILIILLKYFEKKKQGNKEQFNTSIDIKKPVEMNAPKIKFPEDNSEQASHSEKDDNREQGE